MKTWEEIIQDGNLLRFPLVQEKLELLATGYRLVTYGYSRIEADDLDYIDASGLLIISVMAIIANDTKFIETLLDYHTRKRFVWYMLDMLIQCAIDNQKHEIQVMLIDYKYRNNLFRKKQFKL